MQDAKDLQSSSKVPRAGPVNTINEQKAECYQCGGQHNLYKCKYKESVSHLTKKCHQCDKSGMHKLPHSKSTHHIGTESTDEHNASYSSFDQTMDPQLADPVLSKV